jgi:hypothetical protein
MELFDTKIDRCGGQNLYQRQLFFFNWNPTILSLSSNKKKGLIQEKNKI